MSETGNVGSGGSNVNSSYVNQSNSETTGSEASRSTSPNNPLLNSSVEGQMANATPYANGQQVIPDSNNPLSGMQPKQEGAQGQDGDTESGATLKDVFGNLGKMTEEVLKPLLDKMSPEIAQTVMRSLNGKQEEFPFMSLEQAIQKILEAFDETVDDDTFLTADGEDEAKAAAALAESEGAEDGVAGVKEARNKQLSAEEEAYIEEIMGDANNVMEGQELPKEFRAQVNYLVAIVKLIAILQSLKLFMLATDNEGIKEQMDAEKLNMRSQTNIIMERVSKQKVLREKVAKAQAMANDPLLKMSQIFMVVVMAIIAIAMSVLTFGAATPVAVAMLAVTVTAIVISTILSIAEIAGAKVYGSDEESAKTTRMIVNLVLLVAALAAAFGSATAAANQAMNMSLQASMKVGAKAMGAVALEVAPIFIMNSNILFEAFFAIGKAAGMSEEDAAIMAAIVNIIAMIVMMLAMMKFTPKMNVSSWTKGASAGDDALDAGTAATRGMDDAPQASQANVQQTQTVNQQNVSSQSATARLDDAADSPSQVDELGDGLSQATQRFEDTVERMQSQLNDMIRAAEDAGDFAKLDELHDLQRAFDDALHTDPSKIQTIGRQLNELDGTSLQSLDDVDDAARGLDDTTRGADDADGVSTRTAAIDAPTDAQRMSVFDRIKSMSGDDIQEMVQMIATMMSALASLMQGIAHLEQGILKKEIRDLQWEVDLMDIGVELMRAMIPSYQRARENLIEQIQEDGKWIASFHQMLQEAFQQRSHEADGLYNALGRG